EGAGSGTCLAAMGAGISGYVQSARNATRNIVLDGCKVACGAKIFEKAGISYEHYVMTDFGVEKGATPITGDLIEEIAEKLSGSIAAGKLS
ncbi:MAG TPA: putative zinc-binding protein, partial [Rectinemataceae bacterium]